MHWVVSDPQSGRQMHQQLLVGLRHGRAFWQSPSTQPARDGLQGVECWPHVQLMGLFKATFHGFGLLDSL